MKKNIGILGLALILAAGSVFTSCAKKTASDGGQSFSLLVDDNGKLEDKVLLTEFEKESGIHVEVLMFPYAAAVERKNILINSGDYPDAIGGWVLTDNDVMQLGMKDGVFTPLEDLFAEHAPNVMEALNQSGVREAMTLPDGHIYSPPYPIAEPKVVFTPWINEVWLRQLGLSMPTTTEEFKQVLIAFRDRIPNVGGQKIIPFSGDPVNMDIGQFAAWFGQHAALGNRNGGGVAIINDRLELTIIRDEYKEAIKFFAGLYKEGLLDPELFTQDQTTWKAKGKMGLYGVSIGYGPGDFENELHADVTKPRFSYAVLPVLQAPGAARPVYRRNGYGLTIFRTQFVITDKARDPELVVRWLNFIYDKVHSAEAQWGKAGISVEEVNGQMHEIDRSDWPQEKKETWTWGNFWIVSLPKYLRDGKIYPPVGRAPEYNYNDVADELYEPYLESKPIPQLWIAGSDAQRVADISTAVENYVKQKQAEWITGQANVETEWNTYIAQLDRLGVQELLRIKREAMSRRGD